MKSILGSFNCRTITKDNLIERFKVDDWLYILNEVNSAHMYLLIGSEKALLFDTGFGFAPIIPLVKEVTDLPLIVVCSHGHDDHILGCWQFEQAYIDKEDLELCLGNDNAEQREKQILSRRNKTPNIDDLIDRSLYLKQSLKSCRFIPVESGHVFSLGGLDAIVYPIPGHTRGSLSLYVPRRKSIFTGDSMQKNHVLVYAQSLDISAAPQDYIAALSKLETLDIETVWPAHGDTPAAKDLLTDTRSMLIEWAHQADLEKDRMPMLLNSVFTKPDSKSYRYKYKDLSVNYNPGHLEQIHEFMATHNGAVE